MGRVRGAKVKHVANYRVVNSPANPEGGTPVTKRPQMSGRIIGVGVMWCMGCTQGFLHTKMSDIIINFILHLILALHNQLNGLQQILLLPNKSITQGEKCEMSTQNSQRNNVAQQVEGFCISYFTTLRKIGTHHG